MIVMHARWPATHKTETTGPNQQPATIRRMNAVSAWGDALRILVEIAATAAFALSGVMEAARKRLDAVGVCAVAFLCAFGGGTVRDLLLDQRPFFWVAHVELLWGVLGLALLAMLVLRQRHFDLTEKAIFWPDALGLGLFTASGVHHALAAGMPGLVAVLMGVVTGVLGGVLRDMVCNEIPSVLRDHQPYTVCAFAGGWVYLGLWQLQTPGWVALTASVAVTVGLRALAVWRNWSLPPWRS